MSSLPEIYKDLVCCDSDLCNSVAPTPTCKVQTTNPVACSDSTLNACPELSTCGNTVDGTCSEGSNICNSDSNSYCCASGSPYFVDGVCQCPPVQQLNCYDGIYPSVTQTPCEGTCIAYRAQCTANDTMCSDVDIEIGTVKDVFMCGTQSLCDAMSGRPSFMNLICCKDNLCNKYDAPRQCTEVTTNPVQCDDVNQFGACTSLATCGNVQQGTCSTDLTTSARCSAFGNEYCCDSGLPPYFVGGICQCPQSEEMQIICLDGVDDAVTNITCPRGADRCIAYRVQCKDGHSICSEEEIAQGVYKSIHMCGSQNNCEVLSAEKDFICCAENSCNVLPAPVPTPVTIGECSMDSDCVSQHKYCDSNHTCQYYSRVGNSCSPTKKCEPDLKCYPTSKSGLGICGFGEKVDGHFSGFISKMRGDQNKYWDDIKSDNKMNSYRFKKPEFAKPDFKKFEHKPVSVPKTKFKKIQKSSKAAY
eukprot:TRINITY_DN12438_c0_g1_i1.p1 TRINITY_DN12438_c0_g1~~TRINITY_DN12438_c0_g1_i1.p1  ORF type:complete len:553 (-),score=70.19 TRINITY_DN12438_c0_g1_i1:67-1488(-)